MKEYDSAFIETILAMASENRKQNGAAFGSLFSFSKKY